MDLARRCEHAAAEKKEAGRQERHARQKLEDIASQAELLFHRWREALKEMAEAEEKEKVADGIGTRYCTTRHFSVQARRRLHTPSMRRGYCRRGLEDAAWLGQERAWERAWERVWHSTSRVLLESSHLRVACPLPS